MADTQQIKELLGLGLTNEQVATAAGVSASYISQLMADARFAAEVISARTQNLQASTLRDRRYDALEDKLVQKLDDQLDLMYKPREILSALAIINKAQRRGAPAQQALTSASTVVQLNIPAILQQQNININQQVVLSSNKEVIEIDGQTMVTMPSHELLKQLAQKAIDASVPTHGEGRQDDARQEALNRAAKYDEISRFLPAAGAKR
jgi:transcriptional regulator with XRE-family HTH domain